MCTTIGCHQRVSIDSKAHSRLSLASDQLQVSVSASDLTVTLMSDHRTSRSRLCLLYLDRPSVATPSCLPLEFSWCVTMARRHGRGMCTTHPSVRSHQVHRSGGTSSHPTHLYGRWTARTSCGSLIQLRLGCEFGNLSGGTVGSMTSPNVPAAVVGYFP